MVLQCRGQHIPGTAQLAKPLKTHLLRLPDGRDLAVLQLGPDSGRPVFFFHGFTASRLSVPQDDTDCDRLGIRLLAVDRPGTGLSSPSSRPSILGFARDVGEAAVQLGHERFAVIGWSGGGAYALGVAAALPDLVSRATIVSGAAAARGPDAFSGRPTLVKFGQLMSRRATPLIWLTAIGVAWNVRRSPSRAVARLERFVGAADRKVLADRRNRDAVTGGTVEAFRQHWRGGYFDAIALSKDWGFRLADITVPIAFWHGAEDNVVRPDTARHAAARLRSSEVRLVPNAGHFLYLQCWKELLAAVAPGD